MSSGTFFYFEDSLRGLEKIIFVRDFGCLYEKK